MDDSAHGGFEIQPLISQYGYAAVVHALVQVETLKQVEAKRMGTSSMIRAELVGTLQEYGDDLPCLVRRVMVNHEPITGVELIPALPGQDSDYLNISTQ